MMNILVLIKQVPASNKVEVDPVTGVLKRNGAASKMNPYDLFAIETALQLREAVGGEVSVMTMGPPQAEKIMREAYSLGVDRGYILSDRAFAGADVLATAYTLAQGIEKAGGFDLILCGKQTTDGDTAQVGPEVAERLGLPSIAGVTSVEPQEGSIVVEMDMGESIQKARLSFPCLVCVDKDVNQPRLPSYRLREATRTREITIWSLADLPDRDKTHYGLDGSATQVQKIFPPTDNRERMNLTGSPDDMAKALAGKLRDLKFVR